MTIKINTFLRKSLTDFLSKLVDEVIKNNSNISQYISNKEELLGIKSKIIQDYKSVIFNNFTSNQINFIIENSDLNYLKYLINKHFNLIFYSDLFCESNENKIYEQMQNDILKSIY